MNQATTPGHPLRLLFIEDDTRLHKMVSALATDLPFTWTCCATGGEALACFSEHTPDLVLTDLGLPDIDGVDLIEEMVGREPGLPVVVLSVASAESRVLAAITAGASGYIVKDDLGRLPSALLEALGGGVPMSRAAARAVLARLRGEVRGDLRGRERSAAELILSGGHRADARATAPSGAVQGQAPAETGGPLTPREREVVEQLGRGLTYDQVASVLGVSINTVRAHVRIVYEKLGAASKTEAVMLALRRGLVAL